MDGAATACTAFDETVVFLSHFKDLRDPRQQGKVSYPLDEILLLCLLAVLDGDHGRIETRTTTVIHDVDWLRERHNWPGLNAVIMVESSREVGGKIEQETRYYIT